MSDEFLDFCEDNQTLFEDKKSTKNKQDNYRYKHLEKYGLDYNSYMDLLKKQNYKCKVCKTQNKSYEKSLSVDHCHKTGRVRGLLCSSCNIGIGHFKDSIELLQSAIEYLGDS